MHDNAAPQLTQGSKDQADVPTSKGGLIARLTVAPDDIADITRALDDIANVKNMAQVPKA